jgi:hypothetical protein
LKPFAGAAGAEVIAAELLEELLEPEGGLDAAIAALDPGFGREALFSFAGGLERIGQTDRNVPWGTSF